ncbi:MAG: SulP family inorganic anion transporter [Prochlorotrichaceae cyanobacterium]
MKLLNSLSLSNWKGDLFGGITAAIVALPLALAFGVASGAGATAGLYGAIIVGFFAALLGGTPAQVSGPTGPMTVIATTVITTLVARHPEHGLALAFTVFILAGLCQILFGVMRLGQYITLMPYTVISGFMSGIGVIIIILQLPPLLGHPNVGGVIETLKELPSLLSTVNWITILLGGLTLAIVFNVPTKVNRVIPASLLALVSVTLVSVIFFGDATIDRIGMIPRTLPTPHLPRFEIRELADMLRFGLMLGVLGAIDSLLTSLVADNVSRTQHDSDKELIGQGIANCIAGLFGGLPGAGATIRTLVNVQAGGLTPLSGIIHALTLVMVVFWAAPLAAQIPTAVLAGILIKVGIDILDWGFIKRAPRLSMKGMGLMYLVLFLTVFVDLITAVLVGAFIANILTIKRLSDLQSKDIQAITDPSACTTLSAEEQEILIRSHGDLLLLQLSGPLSFGAAKSISHRITAVRNYNTLILDLTDVSSIGVTAALAIESIVQDALQNRRRIWLVVPPGQVQHRITQLELHRLCHSIHPEEDSLLQQVNDRLEALHAATNHVYRSRRTQPAELVH